MTRAVPVVTRRIGSALATFHATDYKEESEWLSDRSRPGSMRASGTKEAQRQETKEAWSLTCHVLLTRQRSDGIRHPSLRDTLLDSTNNFRAKIQTSNEQVSRRQEDRTGNRSISNGLRTEIHIRPRSHSNTITFES